MTRRTLKPIMRRARATMSLATYPLGCPTWRPDPEG